jgi:outer membrane protein assembly factor BamD (BamD/ComL family)
MLVYGWSQSSASEASPSDCENPAKTANQATQAKAQCLQKSGISAIAEAPMRLLNLQWGNGSQQLPHKMEKVYHNLLEQAQAEASADQLATAIAKLSGIPKNSHHYAMAQQLRDDWSREILRQATNHCQQARVSKAIAMLNAIPSTSQLHDRAVELRQHWSEQGKLFNQAIAAKEAGNWQSAIEALQALEGTPLYNSLAVQELMQLAMMKLYEPDETLLQISMSGISALSPEIVATSSEPVEVVLVQQTL